MREFKGMHMCLGCNDKYGNYYNFFSSAAEEFRSIQGKETEVIECPGVTIYDESNSEVVRGVKWDDPHDFTKGYCIVGKPVYAPGHEPKRVVARENAGKIARCKACQDFTVRMRIFNNQKIKGEYSHESPLMPRDHPKNDFNPHRVSGS
jgi:hypothetical protein